MKYAETTDSLSEVSLSAVKSRSVRGVVVLTGRTFILQVIALAAQFLVYGYLGPYENGVFVLVGAIINFLVYFSDIGLAAALIQKKETPSEEDLKTTFTVQQILVLTLIFAVYMLSPFFVEKYSLTLDGKVLLYALCFSFVLSSLKSIPSVLLERRLEFVKLVFPQIIEQVVYSVLLVTLAVNGFGISSFTYAVIARGVVGLILIYYLQPWKPGIAISVSSLKSLFKFGIPYQINTFLATLKDDGLTIVLGSVIGPAQIGILSFAQKIARLPLTFFMDTVSRVTFPAFSRMQESKQDLERSVTRSIFFICFLVFPSLIGLNIITPILIQLIPRYSQWTPAIIPLAFVSINFIFAAATTQLTNLLNAVGKIKVTFYLMVMWTALSWITIPFLGYRFGVNGVALGYALVGSSSLVAIFIAKKHVDFSISDSIIKPLIGSFFMGIVMFILKVYLPPSYYTVLILFVVGSIVYLICMITMIGMSLLEDAKRSVKTIFGKN